MYLTENNSLGIIYTQNLNEIRNKDLITVLDLREFGLYGHLNLKEFRSLKELRATGNMIDDIILPPSIEIFKAECNNFSGILDLSILNNLKEVNLNYNQIEYFIPPRKIEILLLKSNNLKGVPFLPDTLDELDISYNPIEHIKIPGTEPIVVKYNRFKQEIDTQRTIFEIDV